MMEKKRASVQEELDRLEGNAQSKTDNPGEHNFEDEEEDMETENGPSENADEPPQHIPGDSPAENKENRLRSISMYMSFFFFFNFNNLPYFFLSVYGFKY